MSASQPASEEGVAKFSVPPVRKEVRVACSAEEAFQRFTRDIHLWWPMKTHSIGGAQAALVAIEPRLGGRVFERDLDGSEHLWGTVVLWDPPAALAFTWHVGRAPADDLEVSIRFVAETEGGTRVVLHHRGWEKLGQAGLDLRGEYDGGWEEVFGGLYAGYANGANSEGVAGVAPA
jgi:hypothetical protein